MNLTERIESYSKTFPEFPPLYLASNKRIEGLWIIGNRYNTGGYYGAYPHGYLRRVSSLFPEKGNTLHLFSGSLPKSEEYIRFDLKPEADVVGDAHKLSDYFSENYFDIVFADPPYSQEDADHYGTIMVKRKTVFDQALKILKPGGFLVWLDQIFPLHRKDIVDWMLAVGIIQSTNHRVRVVFGFQKK